VPISALPVISSNMTTRPAIPLCRRTDAKQSPRQRHATVNRGCAPSRRVACSNFGLLGYDGGDRRSSAGDADDSVFARGDLSCIYSGAVSWAERICHDTLGFKGLDIRSRPLTFQRKSCCRIEACARSGLLDHLNGDGFDYWSDRLFHFPRGSLHWRGFGLGPSNRPLCRLGSRRFGRLACLTARCRCFSLWCF